MSNIINIKKFIDVSTSVSPTPLGRRDFRNILFVQKANDGTATVITSYTDLESLVSVEGSNTACAKMATVFYGGGFNGIKPSSTVYVAKISAASEEDFRTNFTALMSASDYYMIAMDNELSSYQPIAASINEASTVAHYLFCLDTSADAINESADEDSDSVTAYLFNNKLTRATSIWTDADKAEAYPNVAAASYFGTVRMTAAAPLGNLAYKVVAGVEPVQFTSATVAPSQCWDNLASKNGNAYITLGETGRTCFQAGTCGSGDNIDDYIAADYLNYTITYNVYDLLVTLPKLPMTSEGASMLSSAIASAFNAMYTAGVIAGGTSLDGEVFGERGYKVSVPVPTGVSKATGLWDNIVCKALLSGSGKKVVIGNVLKK